MIVVDTSALVAIAADEPSRSACVQVIEESQGLLMSAGTLAELLIVSVRRNFSRELLRFIDDAAVEIIPVDVAGARRIGAIYRRWGKGFHPAGLNYGDCFAYELATSRDCPLLFVGEDFALTDVQRALLT